MRALYNSSPMSRHSVTLGSLVSDNVGIAMENNIIKVVKPVALGVICFVSLVYLTKSVPVAFIVSLVPLLLGWLEIMQSFAYTIAAMAFLSAVAWAATPGDIKNILKTHTDRAIAEVSTEIKAKP